MSSKFDERMIVVDGEEIIFKSSDFEITNIGKDMRTNPAKISWWGGVKAAAVRERDKADAQYRKWRAGEFVAACKAGGSKKPPDGVIKANTEVDSSFVKFKGALAKCEENIIVATENLEALKKQANTLQSLGAANRAVFEREGMTTKSKLADEPLEDDTDDLPESWGGSSKARTRPDPDRLERVRRIRKKTKKKGRE